MNEFEWNDELDPHAPIIDQNYLRWDANGVLYRQPTDWRDLPVVIYGSG